MRTLKTWLEEIEFWISQLRTIYYQLLRLREIAGDALLRSDKFSSACRHSQFK